MEWAAPVTDTSFSSAHDASKRLNGEFWHALNIPRVPVRHCLIQIFQSTVKSWQTKRDIPPNQDFSPTKTISHMQFSQKYVTLPVRTPDTV